MANDATRRWLVIAFAVLLPVHLFAAVPTTQPATVDVHLDDPVSPQSKCFLDLDTGDTFTFQGRSDGWTIRAAGIDIMCETRDPAEGFASYDLTLVEASGTFDQPLEFRSLR